MNSLPSDLAALVLAHFSMHQQLGLSQICHMWKKLIDSHPLLLNMLDLGGPSVPLYGSLAAFKKSGVRIRHLRLWCHNQDRNFHCDSYPALLLKALRDALPFLRQLSLVGHARPMSQWIAKEYHSDEKEFHFILRFESCSCCLDQITRELTRTKSNTIEIQSSLCQAPCSKKCDKCNISNRWLRLCPCCSLQYCSACNTTWNWANEHTLAVSDLCWCKICEARKLDPLVATPPLWSCSVHCPLH